MKVTWLGTGSAFTLNNYQTSALIELESGYNLLFDCGGDIRHALNAVGKSYLNIDGIYVTHLHADHIGGLEYIAFGTYFDPRYYGDASDKRRPDLFIHAELEKPLWRSLEAGLCTVPKAPVTIFEFFNVHKLDIHQLFNVDDNKENPTMQLIKTVHTYDDFVLAPSYGLYIWDHDVFMPGDTQYTPERLMKWYKKANVIFHDCEIAPHKSGVHAHCEELKNLDQDIKNKMQLVHYQDGDFDEQTQLMESLGFNEDALVIKGAHFEY